MRMRRFLAAFLAAAMVCSAAPASVFATDGSVSVPDEKGKLMLDKKATLENDGSYTINMEAFATGKTTSEIETKGVPLDIVLVIDQSGSMAEKLGGDRTKQAVLKESVHNFVDSVQADGAKHGVQHRIGIAGFASGIDDSHYDNSDKKIEPWKNTGIYNDKGDFIKYRDSSKGEKISYEEYTGPLNPIGGYYVKKGSEYIPLEYEKGFEQYVVVENPATDRTDLYGNVNGTYGAASYGEIVEKVEAAKPTKDDGKTYYSENGNKLEWKETTITNNEYVKTSGIQSGKEYWISYNNDQGIPEWHKVTENIVGSWSDDTYKLFLASGTRFEGKKFLGGGNGIFFDAYELKTTTSPSGEYALFYRNEQYTGKVYEYNTKTGWSVGKVPVTTLYEKTVGAGGWSYTYNGTQYDPIANKDTIYHRVVSTELTVQDYQSALVPVTDGLNGQGNQTASIGKSIDSFRASGATRIATGIEMGNKILADNPLTDEDKAEGRQRVMIIFTDGEPGYNSNQSHVKRLETALAVRNTNYTKNTLNTKVYTIGLYETATDDQKAFTDQLSSNYPDAFYHFKSISKDQLNKNNKNYCAEIDGLKYALTYDGGWKYFKKRENQKLPSSCDQFFEYTSDPGTPITEQKYKFHVKDTAKLNEIFQQIEQDITSASTSVDVTTTSILRDIMSEEGFEFTDKSVVTVNIVPGDGSKAADASGIEWGKAVPVLTLDNLTDGKTVTGTYSDSTGKDMTIKASVHMTNPESGKKALHTVDVTGFDYKDQYIAKAHKGSKIQVSVTGVKALPTVTTDRNVYTNNKQSGIWAPVTEGGQRELKKAFPSMPQTRMTSKTYVMDYAKTVDLPIADIKMTHLRDVEKDGYNPFEVTNSNIFVDHKYGDVSIKGDKMTYTPQTMQWDGYDTFYVFGHTVDPQITAASANANGNAWAKVNVLPANNVYYEDTFETNASTGTAGITYTGLWKELEGLDAGQNPGAIEGEFDNQGWIPVLENETGDTDGTSHFTQASNENAATAKFRFSGEGVDIYSRTSGTTGTIVAKLTNLDTGKQVCAKFVDTLSVSGDYYQIPTLTFHDDGQGNRLPHANYEVELAVTTAATLEDPNNGRIEYYLDGIRVYNPLKMEDAVSDEAYGLDESGAAFVEVRDMLIDNSKLSETLEKGPVFIDQVKEGQNADTEMGPEHIGEGVSTSTIATYKDYGPKNEIYLAAGQSITFKVDPAAEHKYQMGLKSPTGDPVTVSFKGVHGDISSATITHTADMYYVLTPDENGMVTILNESGGLLAITKLKLKGFELVQPVDVFAEASVDEILTADRQFRVLAAEANQAPDVDIENPIVPENPNQHTLDEIRSFINQIFDGFRNWF